MSRVEDRVALLLRALEAGIAGEAGSLPELYSADVRGWSPTVDVHSLDELARELEGRAEVFSELELTAHAAVVDDRAYAEWIVRARHTGPLVVDQDTVIHPTGRPVTMRGVTVAEFSGDRICSFRQYWDEPTLLEGLGLLPRD